MSNRFKIEYNDVQHNSKEDLYILSSSSNNNMIFLKKNIYKNLSSSTLQLLKQKYLIKQYLKKQRLFYMKHNNTKEYELKKYDPEIEQSIENENNLFKQQQEQEEDLELPIIYLDAETNEYEEPNNIVNLDLGLDLNTDIGLDIDNNIRIIVQDQIL